MYVCIPIVFSKFFGDKDSYYTKRSAASRPDRTLQSSNDDSFRSNFFMYSFILMILFTPSRHSLFIHVIQGCFKTAAKTLLNMIKYAILNNKSLKNSFCISPEDKEYLLCLSQISKTNFHSFLIPRSFSPHLDPSPSSSNFHPPKDSFDQSLHRSPQISSQSTLSLRRHRFN
jgi:hypothetical protein